AQSGTVVLLDDANRREERKAVLNWRSSFGPAIRTSSLAGFPRGLSVITIADPIRSAEVPQHGMGGAVRELQRRIEPGTTWIVVDDGQLDWNTFAGRSVLPFLERNGQYWGPPGSGVQAVDELERLRNCGADFIAFVACSFWWLEHYPELRQHLESSFDCRLHDEQLVIYDMRGNRG
ncbi:MAG: hypothetical protein KAI25_04365, partial [Hyphomicrobiaceae bacterium]|nr:hypothetical protein [Hyphomicrobiaceae bacterium]